MGQICNGVSFTLYNFDGHSCIFVHFIFHSSKARKVSLTFFSIRTILLHTVCLSKRRKIFKPVFDPLLFRISKNFLCKSCRKFCRAQPLFYNFFCDVIRFGCGLKIAKFGKIGLWGCSCLTSEGRTTKICFKDGPDYGLNIAPKSIFLQTNTKEWERFFLKICQQNGLQGPTTDPSHHSSKKTFSKIDISQQLHKIKRHALPFWNSQTFC